jgi:hypothetical protein
MLTSFYHRSVLRCGRLAERKSGVADILSAARRPEKIYSDLSRIGYPLGSPRGRIAIYSKLMRPEPIDRPRCGLYFYTDGFNGITQLAGMIVSLQGEC